MPSAFYTYNGMYFKCTIECSPTDHVTVSYTHTHTITYPSQSHKLLDKDVRSFRFPGTTLSRNHTALKGHDSNKNNRSLPEGEMMLAFNFSDLVHHSGSFSLWPYLVPPLPEHFLKCSPGDSKYVWRDISKWPLGDIPVLLRYLTVWKSIGPLFHNVGDI